MKTKKLAGLIVALLLVASFPVAMAQEEVEGDAGITPDSALYGLDVAFDKISLILTFGSAEKARKGLEIAHERLLEAKAMAEQNKLGAMERAREEHAKALDGAKERVREIENDGIPEEAKEALKKVSTLQNDIEAHENRIVLAEDTVMDAVADRLTEEQIARLANVFASIKNNAEGFKATAEGKKETARLTYKAITEKSDEEIELEIEEIEEDTGLTSGRKDRAEQGVERAERAGKGKN